METEVRPQDKHEKRDEERKDKPPRTPRIDHEDRVEEASDESFPASDPPSY
ncbi:MAG: hypothetical protein ACJ76J_00110 [Thermoanaerobaculia bacterium]